MFQLSDTVQHCRLKVFDRARRDDAAFLVLYTTNQIINEMITPIYQFEWIIYVKYEDNCISIQCSEKSRNSLSERHSMDLVSVNDSTSKVVGVFAWN
jgi:hypothetical protein